MQGLFPLFLWIPHYTAVYSVWTEFLLVRRKLSKENSCSWALLFNAQNIPNFEFDLTILFVTEPVLLTNLAHTGRHSPLNLDSQTSEAKGNAVTHLPAHSPLLFLSATWKPACSQVTPPKPLSYQPNSKRPLYLSSPGTLAVHHFLPFSEPFSTMPGELNLNPEFYLCLNMTRKTENPDFTIQGGGGATTLDCGGGAQSSVLDPDVTTQYVSVTVIRTVIQYRKGFSYIAPLHSRKVSHWHYFNRNTKLDPVLEFQCNNKVKN